MMAAVSRIHLLLPLLLLILISARSVGGQSGQWCVASQGTEEAELQAALDWVCSLAGGADCSSIQANGPCFLPDTVRDHASFAFNDYWQKYKGEGATCDFRGAAALTSSDPSHDQCSFPSNP